MNSKHFYVMMPWVVASILGGAAPSNAVPECTVESIIGVNFGAYDVFNTTPTDSAGSITYRCREVAPGTINIAISPGNSNSYTPRQMRQGSDTFNYNLFLDAARSQVWGNGSGGSSEYGPVTPPENSSVTVPIYGRIPAQQNVRAGNGYSDTVTISINF